MGEEVKQDRKGENNKGKGKRRIEEGKKREEWRGIVNGKQLVPEVM